MPLTSAEQAALLAREHPEIADARRRHGPPFTKPPPRPEARFMLLTRSVVGQQVSVTAAEVILARVVETIGGVAEPETILAADPGALRGAGLSWAKVHTLRALAEHCSDGRLDLRRAGRRGEEELRTTLYAVRGIGPWTADMFLMFGLRLPDIWPVGDVAMRRGYALLQDVSHIPTAKEITPMGDCYRPYRSVAAWYCWAEVDSDPADSPWG